ncbi:hypothetical protein AVEN_76886-1 [Araneus ventricosus]|uniref:Uncharacterized protein n=1 Tax=Araneus ventricosus TaxID=182803 RepID=A0A4Y2QPA0_ARAVE|nr:hypothetical protein AVEN_76886-1 [Araneus ventricosus]
MDDEKRTKNNAKQKRYYEEKRNDTNFKEKESLNTSTVTTSKESPHRIPQTLGKAVKKTWNALPQKRMVVSNLVKKVGLKLQKERELNVSDDNPNTDIVIADLSFKPCR